MSEFVWKFMFLQNFKLLMGRLFIVDRPANAITDKVNIE